ncbi:2-amino-4-hydroxy-6-hydroxymethyldihydropteridine diphosphokinase [Pseudorhodoferax sp. Leaf267]|uniref:2-amino-4-hydroxy-6- hydroxymethyldihydropteridine diphosphokinase n=1 Tax=Pseudorhodoferax sp. Leaf267 TaxID=1736316 RepID=UPI000701BC7C|nr:2-amino-4-hydroxy-6-hydroxymethyldihydropteridine diphosphokinase [Pseudorhodoferax sp. Leaf267]KQP18460.1 2-amino-4-hydroxy-6-hydroxymethyldihydropteridine pyrophosphokinase [Pseudorhodoferax sp. Leaf267]
MPLAETQWVQAYIGLGANLGDAAAAVRAAVESIANLPGTLAQSKSPLYRSAPVDAGGPDYVNAVMGVRTILSASELLAQLQRIEQGAGRERPYVNAPRTLDLDLLLFGDQAISTPTLTVPHPRMRERAFVLVPLADIAPWLVQAQELHAVANQRLTPIGA